MPDSGASAIRNGEGTAGGESSESAFQDGEFVGISGPAERRAAPVRDGQEGDCAEPHRLDFETVPSPDDHSEQGRQREDQRAGGAAMADPWTLEGPNPAAPKVRTTVKCGGHPGHAEDDRPEGAEAAPAGGGGDDEAAEGGEGQRMASLLQGAKTHSEYLARGKQLLKRYKRENRVQVADEDVDPREFAAFLIGLRPSRGRL
jgi:hypothetical protein